MTGAAPAPGRSDRLRSGDAAAGEALWQLVYDELKLLASRALGREHGVNTLQTTALVHEAWLKLAGDDADWKNRAHFFGAAARAMRQILVDRARARGAEKRTASATAEPLDATLDEFESRALDLVALDHALDALGAADPRAVNVVELRFFAGLSAEEVARALGVSVPTVERDWRMARAWLRAELGGDDGNAQNRI